MHSHARNAFGEGWARMAEGSEKQHMQVYVLSTLRAGSQTA